MMNVLPTTKVVGKEYGLFFLQFNSVLFFVFFFATRRIQWQNNSSYSSSIRRYSVTLYTTKVILWMSQCLQTSYLIKKTKKHTLTIAEQTWSAFVHFQRPSVLAQEKREGFFIVSHFIHQTVFTYLSQNFLLLCTLPFYIFFHFWSLRFHLYYSSCYFKIQVIFFFFSVFRVDQDFSYLIFVLFSKKLFVFFFQNI